MTGEIISKQIADLKNGICPFCKHGPLMNVDGKHEFSHLGASADGSKHVFNRYHRGIKCSSCKWSFMTYVVK
jgi:hypothetical protein